MIVPTYIATIYIAGDIDTAKRWLRGEAYQHGLCVTVTPTSFIYTGGEETGMAIGLVNYPRFPSTQSDLYERAMRIAACLVRELCQKSALVVASDRTEWVSLPPPGARFYA